MMQVLIAGFGGQGILFTGKVLAQAGMAAGMEVSWLPSYGPEMRGGTANCGVCLSNTPIGCPLVTEPDALIVMNTPSYVKFISNVKPGGRAFLEASLVDTRFAPEREDIEIDRVNAMDIAEANGLTGMGGIILLGRLLSVTEILPFAVVEEAFSACLGEKKAHLLQPNLRALRLGAGNI